MTNKVHTESLNCKKKNTLKTALEDYFEDFYSLRYNPKTKSKIFRNNYKLIEMFPI